LFEKGQMGSELSFGKTLCILQSANLWTRYFLTFRGSAVRGQRRALLVIAERVSDQSKPASNNQN
jgi:hypothetical protein